MMDILELDFGYGELEVMHGCHKDKYSLMIGKNGNGIIGESISKDRYVVNGELLAVMHFNNVASIDVVINQLSKLKYNMENKLPYYVKNEFGEIVYTLKPVQDSIG